MNRKSLILSSAAILSAMFLNSCEEQKPDNGGETPGEEEITEVYGTWEAGSIVEVKNHLLIPEGRSLTIEPGVQVIISTEGVGTNHAPIEITVDGNLYCMGSEEAPVLFSVDEELRTEENALKGLWGGIVASATCEEMLVDYTVIEYTGGQVIEGSPAAASEVYTAGDDAYPQITTNNINGRYVITNSILRNGYSDAIYLMGGNAIISGNIFAANGYDGGEAVNVKAGCKVDVSGNIMFSPNTNGLKLSSSGQSSDRGMALIQAYNNTIINAGWRRDGEKGGCIYVEKNALANVFNNLLVNCKFRAMTPSWAIPDNPEEGYNDDSFIDYNYYASGSQESDIVFEDESGVKYAYEGYCYEHEDYNPEAVDIHSKIASEDTYGSLDPDFANFDINSVPLTSFTYDMAWDFHVNAGSEALKGAYSGNASALVPYFLEEGLQVNGTTYKSPAVQAYFGAFGEK